LAKNSPKPGKAGHAGSSGLKTAVFGVFFAQMVLGYHQGHENRFLSRDRPVEPASIDPESTPTFWISDRFEEQVWDIEDCAWFEEQDSVEVADLGLLGVWEHGSGSAFSFPP